MGNHGKDNFEDGHYCWDRLGKPWETMDGHYYWEPWETMGKITSRTDITTGTGSGNHGKDNFEDGCYYWDRLGKAWDSGNHGKPRMGITTGTDSGNHGKPWER